jgi:hypothetical protein
VPRSRVTLAAWHTDYYEPNNPSMNSAIVKEGSSANGDGHESYAARRRNLACRPLVLGRHHGAHERLPLTATNQPAGTTAAHRPHLVHCSSRQKPSNPPGKTTTLTTALDQERES